MNVCYRSELYKRSWSLFGGEKAERDDYPFNLRLTKPPPTFPPIFFYSQLVVHV